MNATLPPPSRPDLEPADAPTQKSVAPPKQKPDFTEWFLRVVVVIVGTMIGAVLSVFIGLFTGIIEIC